MCSRDYIKIGAIADFFKYHNVPLKSLHLTNKSCRAQREVINGVSYYMSRVSKDDYLRCGGKPLEVQLEHCPLQMPDLSLLSCIEKDKRFKLSPLIVLCFVNLFFPFLQKNNTHVSYSLSLRSDPQVVGNIIRNPVIKMDYTCVYPYIRRVSLPFPVVPYSRQGRTMI